MDASAQRYGAGHQLIKHDWAMVVFMRDYYRRFAPDLGLQACREVALHVAYDKGLIHRTDIGLMSDLTRVLERRGGPRRHLGSRLGTSRVNRVARSARGSRKPRLERI